MENIFYWCSFFILETAKYVLLTYGIFGFSWTKKKTMWLIPAGYAVAGGAVTALSGMDDLYFRTFWGMVLLLSLFEGRVVKKLQCFLVDFFLIDIVDSSVLVISNLFFPIKLSEKSIYLYQGLCLLGLLFLLCVFFLGKKFLLDKNGRKLIREGFETLKSRYYILIMVVLIGSASMTAVLTERSQQTDLVNSSEIFAVASITLTTAVSIFIVLFLYIMVLKQRLEEQNEIKERSLRYQEHYYADKIKKDEELRGFRHDMDKHLSAIKALCRKGEGDAAVHYIENIHHSLHNIRIPYTGHTIADYFLNETIEEIKKTGSLTTDIHGKFPDDLPLSNDDLSILWGNAMDNAKEELLRCGGVRKLKIEIQHYNGTLYLTIANTYKEKNTNLRTKKKDKNLHGHGIQNMRAVVERYHGMISWEYEEDLFVVKIEI